MIVNGPRVNPQIAFESTTSSGGGILGFFKKSSNGEKPSVIAGITNDNAIGCNPFFGMKYIIDSALDISDDDANEIAYAVIRAANVVKDRDLNELGEKLDIDPKDRISLADLGLMGEIYIYKENNKLKVKVVSPVTTPTCHVYVEMQEDLAGTIKKELPKGVEVDIEVVSQYEALAQIVHKASSDDSKGVVDKKAAALKKDLAILRGGSPIERAKKVHELKATVAARYGADDTQKLANETGKAIAELDLAGAVSKHLKLLDMELEFQPAWIPPEAERKYKIYQEKAATGKSVKGMEKIAKFADSCAKATKQFWSELAVEGGRFQNIQNDNTELANMARIDAYENWGKPLVDYWKTGN